MKTGLVLARWLTVALIFCCVLIDAVACWAAAQLAAAQKFLTRKIDARGG